jgi:hypothetical protein
MIRTAAAIAVIFLVSCTYAPRSTNQTYTARQMAIGVTSQPTRGMTSTTTVEEAPASGDAIPSSQQHLATYPEVRVPELASTPTSSRSISGASNFITIGSTRNDVARIQGTPKTIEDLSIINEENWDYGYYNRINFKNGLVSGWNNSNGKLKVSMGFE